MIEFIYTNLWERSAKALTRAEYIEEMRKQIDICREYLILGEEYAKFDRILRDVTLAENAPEYAKDAYSRYLQLERDLRKQQD